MRANATKIEASAEIFAALGDKTRLELVSRLCEQGPMSISQLTEGTRLTRQAITKHLEVMESAGLVLGSRFGREKIWELENKRMEMAKTFLAQVSKDWDEALDRLKKWVED